MIHLNVADFFPGSVISSVEFYSKSKSL